MGDDASYDANYVAQSRRQNASAREKPSRIGVLISNLGTPDAPEKAAVKRYLKEFLWDRRVVDTPRWLWWPILHGVILNFRPARSAAAYREIWTAEGSPLLAHTRAQALALAQELSQAYGEEVVVDFGMRYGQPSLTRAVQGLIDQGIEQLLVLPLYPQYSATTTASTFDALAADLQARRFFPELHFIPDYHRHPAYISALATHIRNYRDKHGAAEKLLFSYHGIPQRYGQLGDPYEAQCLETSRLLVAELGLEESEHATVFQSRFGREPWLQPYTDKSLQVLGKSGVESVQIVCPGFSSDCLETLEEIAVENRDYFLKAGGKKYQYIPCLNSSAEHIQALAAILQPHLPGTPR